MSAGAVRVLGINAVHGGGDGSFWRMPEPFLQALAERLPGWTLAVARTPAEIAPVVRRSRLVVGWPFPRIVARGAPHLEAVHFFTAHVPESWAGAELRVTSARGGNARSVAQHGLFLALAALRGLRRDSFARWDPEAFFVARAPERLGAAIFGHGAIGGHLAPLLVPLFREVRAVSRARVDAAAPGVIAEEPGRWDALARWADVLFLALPLTKETRARLGPPFWEALKPDAVLINLARGELIDEADVLAWLARDGRARYVTDVTHPEPYPSDQRLATCDQVLISPHVGARREDAWRVILDGTLAAVDALLAGGAP